MLKRISLNSLIGFLIGTMFGFIVGEKHEFNKVQQIFNYNAGYAEGINDQLQDMIREIAGYKER